MVDILTGRVNPSARLPITYPKYEDGGGIPYLHAVSDMCTDDADGGTLPHWVNAPCEVQWPFGHGLSYTQFEYDNLKLNTQTLQYHHCQKEEKGDDSSSLTITVTVKNTGVMAGAESVLFFTFDEARSSTPEYKRLRGFKKVWLEAGTSTQVHLTIPLDDFRFVGPHDDAHYVFQDKLSFRVGIGADTDCRTNIDDPRCSSPVTIRTDPDYVGACEAACNLWSESGCSQHLEFSMENCWDICSSIHQNVEIDNDLEMNNDGW